jgi:hypothetical protein
MDFHVDRLIPGPPQTAPNPVLTDSLDLQNPIAIGHRLLDPFFQNPGRQTMTIFHACNPM